MAANPIRVFIVDDHQLVVEGIQSLLSNTQEVVISGIANNPFLVLELLERTPTDILLTDINMPGISGSELAKLVKRQFPGIKIIGLSMLSQAPIVNEMMEAGVSGYILKNIFKDELLLAIRAVYGGQTYYSAEVMQELLKSMQTPRESRLTNREIEIIRLIEKEMSNKQIADKLFISESTVETHRKNIFRKTKTHSLVGLVKYAYEQKII